MPAADLFADAAMAAGYAADRPPVHEHLMARLVAWSGWRGSVDRALDVGCGAGASTAALAGLASHRIGVDPYPAMVGAAQRADAGADFVVGAAEALPVTTASVDLLAAAGSLNYADVAAFLVEAVRVLRTDGCIAVSNFGFGHPGIVAAPGWVEDFRARWPRPPSKVIDRTTLAAGAFRVVVDDEFPITLTMTRDAYLAYVMTETSVAAAVAAGEAPATVRGWLDDRLPAEWESGGPVRFAGSLLVLDRSPG